MDIYLVQPLGETLCPGNFVLRQLCVEAVWKVLVANNPVSDAAQGAVTAAYADRHAVRVERALSRYSVRELLVVGTGAKWRTNARLRCVIELSCLWLGGDSSLCTSN